MVGQQQVPNPRHALATARPQSRQRASEVDGKRRQQQQRRAHNWVGFAAAYRPARQLALGSHTGSRGRLGCGSARELRFASRRGDRAAVRVESGAPQAAWVLFTVCGGGAVAPWGLPPTELRVKTKNSVADAPFWGRAQPHPRPHQTRPDQTSRTQRAIRRSMPDSGQHNLVSA